MILLGGGEVRAGGYFFYPRLYPHPRRTISTHDPRPTTVRRTRLLDSDLWLNKHSDARVWKENMQISLSRQSGLVGSPADIVAFTIEKLCFTWELTQKLTNSDAFLTRRNNFNSLWKSFWWAGSQLKSTYHDFSTTSSATSTFNHFF